MDLAAQDGLCLGGMKRAKDGFCKFVASTVCEVYICSMEGVG